MLKVHAKKLGAFAVLCLRGRIVRGETAALSMAVDSLTGVNTVVLDLARVSTVDAGGLGVLLELREQTRAKGIDFKLMNLTRPVSGVLEITCLNSVFDVTSDKELLSAVSLGRPVSAMELVPCASS